MCVVCAYVFVHVCRMDDNRQPKRLLLFGEPLKPRHFHGTKQHWGDVVNTDLKSLKIPLNDWYDFTPLQAFTSSIPEAFHKLHVLIVIQVYSVLLEFLIVHVAALSVVEEI